MNPTIKEATVKRDLQYTHSQPETHLNDFIEADFSARLSKSLQGLTPFDCI